MKYIIFVSVIVVIVCIFITTLYNLHLKRKYDSLHKKLQDDYCTSLDKLIRDIATLNSEREQLKEARNSEIKYFLHKSILHDYLKYTLVFQHIATHDYLEYNRFYNYLHDEYKNVKHDIKSVTITAEIKGKAPKAYNTTLNECDCYDFKNTLRRKEPCKHMYMLAYELALLNELPHQEIKKELALATHKYTKAVQEYNKINKTK